MNLPSLPELKQEPAFSEEVDLEIVDGPTDVQPDLVPTGDQPEPRATYRDWNIYNTRVISCAIGNSRYTGDRYETRDEARAATELKYGKVLEANYVPGRAFFRVAYQQVKVR